MNDGYYSFKESHSGSSLIFNQSEVSFVANTEDQKGDEFLKCMWDLNFYNTATQQCEIAISICNNPEEAFCSNSGYALTCQTNYIADNGQCVSSCSDTAIAMNGMCFEGIPLTGSELTLHENNSFTIKFDAPLTLEDYNAFISTLTISISGPLSSYSYTTQITPTFYLDSTDRVESVQVQVSVENTIRSADDVKLQITYEAQFGSGVLQSANAQIKQQVNPKFASQIQTVDTAVYGVSVTIQSTAAVVIGQVIITDGALKYLWGLVNASQLMALVQLIKFPLPSNTKSLFQLLSLANGDFEYLNHLPNVFREEKIVDIEQLQQQKPLNSHFKAADFQSTSFFLLCEPKIVLILFYFAFILPLVIMAFIIQKQPCCFSKCCYARIVGFFSFNFWIRLLLQLSLQFSLIMLLAMQSSFMNISTYKLDFALTLLSLLVFLGFFIFMLTKFLCYTSSVVKKQKTWRFKVLTQDLNLTKHKKCALMYYPIFVAERFFFAFILVVFQSKPVLTSVLSLALFTIAIGYLIVIKPFQSNYINNLQIFNKFAIAALCSIIIYLSYKGNELSQQQILDIGYGIVALILTIILVNFIVLIINCIVAFASFCKQIRQQCKKKSNKYRAAEGDSQLNSQHSIFPREAIHEKKWVQPSPTLVINYRRKTLK